MRDLDIRCALLDELKSAHDGEPDTLILNELGLCQGNARVDVAVINGAINGYEIKSERDTLKRLPAQQAIYSRVLDNVTVVAGTQHVNGIVNAAPPWWGIEIAVAIAGVVKLESFREPTPNPQVDSLAVAQLLWRDEALAVLRDLHLDSGMLSKPRRALWGKLAECVPKSDLCFIVRQQLKAREKWRSDQRPSRDGG